MVRGGSLLILRFVGQMSRSQLLKIEQKIDKIEMLDLNETWYTPKQYIKKISNAPKVRKPSCEHMDGE
jgi:hypothetical protein